VGICGVAVAGLVVGLSQTYFMMIIFLALMGLTGGGYHPASPPLVTASVEPEDRGSALGVHIIGGSAAYFLAPLIAAGIAVAWGWRGPFIALAIPSMVFGIIFFIVMGRALRAEKVDETAGLKKTTQDDQTLDYPGRVRRLVTVIFLITCCAAMTVSIQSFIPLLLVDRFGVAEEAAGAYLAISYSCGLWVSPIAGYLSDRFGRIPLLLTVCLASGPVVYLFTVAPLSYGIPLLLVIMGIITYFRMPLTESYIIGHTRGKNRSTILGIYYFSAMEGSGVLAPLVGYLIDTMGYQNAFGLVGATMVSITLVCSLLLRGGYD
jgi:predicted MFS family arabinose efflux permease